MILLHLEISRWRGKPECEHKEETLLMSLTESEDTGEITVLLFVDTVVFRRRSSHFAAHKFTLEKSLVLPI